MADIVPIDALPASVRASIRPGSPSFLAYAKAFEDKLQLPSGALTGAKFTLTPDQDALGILSAAARDQAQDARRVPPELLPPSAAGAAGAPGGNASVGGPRTTAPAPEHNPAKGDYPAVGPLGLDLSERVGNAAAGFGKSFMDTIKGVGQATAPLMDMVNAVPRTLSGAVTGKTAPTLSSQLVPSAADVDALHNRDQPLLANPEGSLGNVTGTIAQLAVPSGELAKGAEVLNAGVRAAGKAAPPLLRRLPTGPVAQGAVVGAGYDAAQPVGSDEDRTTNAALGGATGGLGGLLTGGITAMGRAARDSAAPAIARLADRAAAMGIPLRASQVSDSPWLKWATTALDALPFSGSKTLGTEQQKAFNRVLSRTMGEDSEQGLDAMRNARTKLSGTYDDLKDKNDLQLEPWHVDAMNDVNNGYAGTLATPDQAANLKALKALQRSVVNSTDPNGIISGPAYKDMRSQIGNLANNTTNNKYALALKGHQNILDKAFKSGLSPEDSALLDLTDKQWGNMRTLEGIAPSDASGDWNFPALARSLSSKATSNSSGRAAFVQGQGQGDQELPDIARIGTQFLNRGPGSGVGAGYSLGKMGKAALGVGEMGGAAGGLYALNHKEETPIMDTAQDLGGLLLASHFLGRGLNSRWFERGVPAIEATGKGLNRAGLSQIDTAYLNAQRNSVPRDPYALDRATLGDGQ